MPLCEGGPGSHPTPNHVMGNLQSTRHSLWVIRPAQHMAKNSIFYSRSAVPNILQYYFGIGEDDVKQGLIPDDTPKVLHDMNRSVPATFWMHMVQLHHGFAYL